MKTKSLAAFLLLTVATVASGFQTPPEWVKYTPVEGRYSVLMPKEPKLSTQEAAASTGQKLLQYMAETSDSNSLYIVGYFDILSGMTFSLDKARDAVVASVKGTLLSDDAISLGAHPGRELKVSAKKEDIEVLARGRIYSIGGRVYILQHVFLKSSDSPTMAEKTAKFFDSFKVTMGK